jgi:hypothetical protein
MSFSEVAAVAQQSKPRGKDGVICNAEEGCVDDVLILRTHRGCDTHVEETPRVYRDLARLASPAVDTARSARTTKPRRDP